MRIVFIGDIMGRSGREALMRYLPDIKSKLKPDFIVVNVDNAAHGFGINKNISQQIFEAGADVLTGGNHIWDQRDIINWLDDEPRLLRPANFPNTSPGKGYYIARNTQGRTLLVVHLQGRLFMDSIESPFLHADQILARHATAAEAILVDFHAEATSEKMAMGHYLDGRVSAVIGTHTHSPTADTMILPKGTAYQTDVGMTGCYDISVIGMKTETPLHRFTKQIPGGRLAPAEGDATLAAVCIDTADKSLKATKIQPIRQGGALSEMWPE